MRPIVDAPSPALPRRAPAAIEALRSPGYGHLWTASLLWNQARWMDMVVLGWVVLEITDSAWHVALVGVLRSAPILVFGLLGGAVADRFERRRLLIGVQAMGGVVSLAVAGLLATGLFRFEHAVAAALLLGLQWAIDWPTRRALVPDLVGRDLTQNAIVLESISMNFTRVIGPLAAGLMIAYVGGAAAYLVMALLYLVEIVLLALMPLAVRQPGPPTGSVLRYLREGWEGIRHSEPIVGVLLITVFMNAFAFPYQQLLPVFARDVLGVDAIGLGILGAAAGVGSLTGALVLVTRRRVARPGLLFTIGSFVMCGGLVGFALSDQIELAALLLVVSGLGSASFAAFQSTIILATAPDAIRGRAMGALTLAIGTAPIGLLEIGALTEIVGAPTALAVNAGLCAVLIVVTALMLPRLRAE